jgi:radical SAM protein with 4Fe4S-binding SPASM domain
MIRYSKIPYAIRLLLTKRCNLNCTFCLDDAWNAAPRSEELTTSEWLKFFERLKELKIFDVSLSGGEIFLRDDLFTMLKTLKENRVHRLTLLTNGTLITPGIAGQLRQIDIKNISISLDGLEEVHDNIRGKGAFQKAARGIQNLINAGIFPAISFTATKTNCKDLDSLIDFIAGIGIRTIGINNLSPEGRCLNIYKDIVPIFPGQNKQVSDVVEEKRNKYPEMKIECGLGFYYHLPRSYEYFKENPQNYKIKHLKDGCGAASTSCLVTSTGEVLPCNGLTMFPGGNIRESDLPDIWTNSENFKQIRDLAKLSMDEVPHCKSCKYRYICDGGCRASAYMVYKDILAPSVLCPFFDGEKISSVEQEEEEK